jgi:putative ABC transport system ATP-binding protein
MKIELQNVIPLPIKELNYQNSDIWNKNPQFEKSKKYLVKAPSGTGKTTLLSLIYGIRNDYEGQCLIDNKIAKSINIKEFRNLRKNHLSFVFQGLKLFPELSGYENIEIKNRITNQRTKQEIYQFADKLGVKQLLERKADILSFGQQQRLAIIRSLCQPFDFLLLDEPFSHLDPDNAKKCLELIFEVCDKINSGFILTTLSSDYGFNYDVTFNL